MFGIGPFELIILLVVLFVIAGGVALVGLTIAKVGSGFRLPRFGRVTLNCPHCGAETPAHLGKCKSCGEPLS